jgi:hypothetical protein
MGMADKFRQKAEQLQHEAGKRMGGRKGERGGRDDRGRGGSGSGGGGEERRRSEDAQQATEKGRSQHGEEQRRGGAGDMTDRARNETKDRFEH